MTTGLLVKWSMTVKTGRLRAFDYTERQTMNQEQLLELGLKHQADPQVDFLVGEIRRAWCDVHAARIVFGIQLTPIDSVLERKIEGQNVGQSNTGLVEYAAKLASALDRVAHCYLMLACALQRLGLKIDY